jgi:pimeloyl-ACP methyl ester carboxylesterase
MSPSIRRTIYILTSILVLYIVGIFFIYIFIDYIVFSPVRHSQNQRYSTPEPYKEIKLDHPNGQKFNMLCFKSRSQAKANMLLLHGVAKSADWWSDYVPFFTERGFNVYIPDYRGYGKSEGRATEIGLYEDAQISMGWLRNQTSEDSIVLYGVDLAACVAAYVSTISPSKTLCTV